MNGSIRSSLVPTPSPQLPPVCSDHQWSPQITAPSRSCNFKIVLISDNTFNGNRADVNADAELYDLYDDLYDSYADLMNTSQHYLGIFLLNNERWHILVHPPPTPFVVFPCHYFIPTTSLSSCTLVFFLSPNPPSSPAHAAPFPHSSSELLTITQWNGRDCVDTRVDSIGTSRTMGARRAGISLLSPFAVQQSCHAAMAISKMVMPRLPLPGSRSSGQGMLTWDNPLQYNRNFHLQCLLWCFP